MFLVLTLTKGEQSTGARKPLLIYKLTILWLQKEMRVIWFGLRGLLN